MEAVVKRINLDEPRYDQSTYSGRAKHFFITTNPLNLFTTGSQLDHAKDIVDRYRNLLFCLWIPAMLCWGPFHEALIGIVNADEHPLAYDVGSMKIALEMSPDWTCSQCHHCTTTVVRVRGESLPDMTEDEIWKAKHLYDSAFHPDTKEKMFILGRMSAQVPMNMTITGCMMTFYKTTPAVLFWQWFNQSFNAIVNYTNRSGDNPISPKHLGISYVLATGGAVTTALTLNSMVKKFSPLIGRFVPFAAVAAANCINIPCMRSRELMHGIPILDENGNRVGESTRAASSAIAQVVFSRVMMATPGMMIPPFIMEHLNKKAFLKKMPWLNAPIQVMLIGFFLVFATPLCCALFPQKSSMSVNSLEPEVREKLLALPSPPSRVYFNKGL